MLLDWWNGSDLLLVYWLQQSPPSSMAVQYLVNIFEPGGVPQNMSSAAASIPLGSAGASLKHSLKVPSHSLFSVGSTPSTFRIQPEMQSRVKLCSKIIEHPIRSFLSLYDKHTLRVAQRVLRHPTHALSTPLSSFILCFSVCHLLFDCVHQLNCPPWE